MNEQQSEQNTNSSYTTNEIADLYLQQMNQERIARGELPFTRDGQERNPINSIKLQVRLHIIADDTIQPDGKKPIANRTQDSYSLEDTKKIIKALGKFFLEREVVAGKIERVSETTVKAVDQLFGIERPRS